MSERMLVTGGAGFIGSYLVDALLEAGHQVRVLDNFSTGKRENLQFAIGTSRLTVTRGDIRDEDIVRQAMEGVDCVFHLASLVSVPQSMLDPQSTHDVNVTGTLNVLQAARQPGVKRLVFSSSCSVYGDNDDLPLKETAVPRPLSPYAASKLAGEFYCQAFGAAYGLPTVSLRYFNVYGPRQNPAGDYAAVIPKFAARIKAGQPPVIYGDGQQTRDFVHVSDVVRANVLACEQERAVGQVVNVASGQSASLLELVSIFNKLCGTQFAPQFRPERAGDILHSVGSGEQLVSTLGFVTKTPLLEGLQQLMAV